MIIRFISFLVPFFFIFFLMVTFVLYNGVGWFSCLLYTMDPVFFFFLVLSYSFFLFFIFYFSSSFGVFFICFHVCVLPGTIPHHASAERFLRLFSFFFFLSFFHFLLFSSLFISFQN